MGTYTRTYSLTDGTTAYGSQVVAELDALGASVNNIVNAQIASGAAIADSKLATISTAGKVSGAALTSLTSVPAGAGVIPGANIPFATAAEVKTGTEAAEAVAPSTMISHEGVIKGWINFNGSGTPTSADNFNVSSIDDNGAGDYTINWDTNFGSANYAVVGSAREGSGANTSACVSISDEVGAMAVGSTRVTVRPQAVGTLDADVICVIAIGDR